ncbi:oligosaccharide flippase family protein [Enterococcus casseliflavus]|uniref:oligosaccharide flippase family protein n=1 Tax=Enterococcus TaxID=1350 RepID=UPI0018929D4F|nr:oligosaccharide flippase family protein [Enterococcus casseliflavus]
MKKLFHNLLYQSFYQMMLLILPIITIPVVSKALGPEGIGFYNYVYSIVSYFVLFAGLGLANYGIREIALVRNNKESLSRKFWELELFNIIIVSIILVTYFIFLNFVNDRVYYLVSGLIIVATLFDISWFFAGIENFKAITLGNLIIKLSSFFLILIFVNTYDDLFMYFCIQIGNILMTNILLWVFLIGKISFVKVDLKSIISHFYPALGYLFGKMAITLYTTLNKTLLGIMSTTALVGIYANSMQLNSIIVTLIATLDTVLLPHMTGLISDNKENQIVNVMKKTLNLQFFFSIGAFFGILTVYDKLVPWFFGEKFLYLNKTIPILSILIIIIPLGTSIVRQFLIPKNQIKDFNISVVTGAIIGVLLNFSLIPVIGIWGAIVATIVSELFVTSIRVYRLIKDTDFCFNLRNIILYILSGFIMLMLTRFITKDLSSSLLTNLIQIVLGGLIYLGCTLILKINPLTSLIKQITK